MLIEVVQREDESNTEKGNLLERLAEDFLKVQGYEVSRQVRITASELDLLCKHKVSGKQVYVECKAHKQSLSADVFTKLLGTIEFNEFSEGWLISTGPLGKDAKGFLDQWEKKRNKKKQKLSIYTPERILHSLQDAKIIEHPPTQKASELIRETNFSMGDWVLLLTPWGYYWACPLLRSGLPNSVVLFCVVNAHMISDAAVFTNIKHSDSNLKEFEFLSAESLKGCNPGISQQRDTPIVEVEFGEKWSDYRPARPEHFVGRKKVQKELLQFFTSVKRGRTDTRIFAIKGDSGIGKSSLVAKIRDVARISYRPSNLFLYAVDMRAANDATYVSSSLIKALSAAAAQGFGQESDLKISNFNDPLQSGSINEFLSECNRKHELIILVLDQFEELYSKSELFSVFEAAKKLMFSTISASSNIILGFAWKTDSSVPQDHPAYHMWHELFDHRYEVSLGPFSHSDAEQSLKDFEAELGVKIRPELRKYLLENSQGYPWLLKKLCIHFYHQLESGVSQQEIENRSLDISSLFDQDLNNLDDAEMGCLRLVAQKAPMDWFEVLEYAGRETVQSLQNKRLLIRRGDKLNLYWDIFRDYVRFNTIPSIPFTYIPQSPSIGALLRVSQELDDTEGITLRELAEESEFKESTVRNIVHDLEQFGLINFHDGRVRVGNHMTDFEERTILSSIRVLFKRHELTKLIEIDEGLLDIERLIMYLKEINPAAQHHIRTWRTYANRMVVWLEKCGLLKKEGNQISYEDLGRISDVDIKHRRYERRRMIFLGDTSPAKVVEAFDLLKEASRSRISMKDSGFRNACSVLSRFRLIETAPCGDYRVPESFIHVSSVKLIWEETRKERSIRLVMDLLRERPNLSAEQIGKYVAERFNRDWKPASCKRVGNSLRQWGKWLMISGPGGAILPPPGRKTSIHYEQPSLFELGDEGSFGRVKF